MAYFCGEWQAKFKILARAASQQVANTAHNNFILHFSFFIFIATLAAEI
jgi:hypothetical protein